MSGKSEVYKSLTGGWYAINRELDRVVWCATWEIAMADANYWSKPYRDRDEHHIDHLRRRNARPERQDSRAVHRKSSH